MTTGQTDNDVAFTALEVAERIKSHIDERYSDTPGLFDRLCGSVLTNVEARQRCGDLFTVDNNVALVMIVEGIYEWSDWAALSLNYTGWFLQPLTGYALALYPETANAC